MTTAAEPVLTSVTEGVATLTLNRPHAMNSLDAATKASLREQLESVAADPAVRCVLLAAEGRAFCVGQDLREHAALLDSGEADVAGMVREEYAPLVRSILTMDKPVVAAVNGVAAGAGAALAFAADLRVMADTASYALAFTSIGLACDTGLSWTLPRLVGQARAIELLYSPAPVRADAAHRLGLATEVVPAAELSARAFEVARTLAEGPTRSYAEIRHLVHANAHAQLDDALAAEGEAMARAAATQDHRRAVESFLAKEQPVFTGR